jgi:hypothetical protein
MEHFKEAYTGQVLDVITNIRLGKKELLGSTTQAYLAYLSVSKIIA